MVPATIVRGFDAAIGERHLLLGRMPRPPLDVVGDDPQREPERWPCIVTSRQQVTFEKGFFNLIGIAPTILHPRLSTTIHYYALKGSYPGPVMGLAGVHPSNSFGRPIVK